MHQLNILIADGFGDQDSLLVDALHERGHRVEVTPSLKHLLADDKTLGVVDLIIAGHPSPFGDCLATIAAVRLQHPEIGIILRTADSHAHDAGKGFTNGADVVLARSMAPMALVSAIETLGRRIRRARADLVYLDSQQAVLMRGATRVPLTTNEATLLAAFSKASKQQLEHGQMVPLISRSPATMTKSALEIHIVRLRKKLQQLGLEGPSIKSIRGHGYQLCTPLRLIYGM